MEMLHVIRRSDHSDREKFVRDSEDKLLELSYALRQDSSYEDYYETEGSLEQLKIAVDYAVRVVEEAERATPENPLQKIWKLFEDPVLKQTLDLFSDRKFALQDRRFQRMESLLQLPRETGMAEEEVKNLFKDSEEYAEYKEWRERRESDFQESLRGMKNISDRDILQRMNGRPSKMGLLAGLNELAHRGSLYLSDRRIWRSLEDWQAGEVFTERVSLDDPRIWDDKEQDRVHAQYRLITEDSSSAFGEYDPEDETTWHIGLDRACYKIWGKSSEFSRLHQISQAVRREHRSRLLNDLSDRSRGVFRRRARSLERLAGLIALEHVSNGHSDPQRYLACIELLSHHPQQLVFLLVGQDLGLIRENEITAYREERFTHAFPPEEWFSPQNENYRRVIPLVDEARRTGGLPILFLDQDIRSFLRRSESAGSSS